MATWYIDYSAKRLTGSVIKGTAVGPAGEHPSGVIRYIDAPGNLQTKHVDQAEYASLKAAGLELPAAYFEIGYEDPNGGYAGGQANARRALAGADWLGFKGIILMCCDRWFVQPPHNPVTVARWQAYLDGAVSILGRGRTGAYGFSDAMDAARGHVDYFVQCGARSAVRDFVHGWQDNNTKPTVGGISTDRVLMLKNFTSDQGELVATQAEIQAIAAAVGNEIMSRQVDYGMPGSPHLLAFSDGERWTNIDVSATRAMVTQLVAQQGGASAAQIAAALLPALTSALVAEVAKVDAITDADAQQIAEAVTARTAALLGGTA